MPLPFLIERAVRGLKTNKINWGPWLTALYIVGGAAIFGLLISNTIVVSYDNKDKECVAAYGTSSDFREIENEDNSYRNVCVDTNTNEEKSFPGDAKKEEPKT